MKTVGQNKVRKVRNKIACQRIKIPYLKINSNERLEDRERFRGMGMTISSDTMGIGHI